MIVNNRKIRSLLSAAFCVILVAVMVLSISACRGRTAVVDPPKATEAIADNDGIIEKGTGAKTFTFKAVNKAGETTTFSVHTDKTLLDEALLEVELVAGDLSEYGLYVKTVNGETLDYTADGYWWALYIGDAMAEVGVSSVNVEDGATYSFVATPAT